MEYFIRRRNGILGPYDAETLKEKKNANQLQSFDEIGESKKGPWIAVKEMHLFTQAPKASPSSSATAANSANTQSFGMSPSDSSAQGSPDTLEIYNPLDPIGSNEDLMTTEAAGPKVEWYYRDDEGEPGPPVSEKAIRDMIKRGDLDKGFLVWNDSMEDWATITSIFSVDFRIKKNRDSEKGRKMSLSQKYSTQNNREIQNFHPRRSYAKNEKSILVAYLLFLFLSGLGAHAFYLGKYGKGIWYIFINIAFWMSFIVANESIRNRNENGLVIFGFVFIAYSIQIFIDLITLGFQVSKYNDS